MPQTPKQTASLAALQGLQANDPTSLYGLQKQRQSELRGRVGPTVLNGLPMSGLQEAGSPYGVYNRDTQNLPNLNRDIEETEAFNEPDATYKANQAAIGQGFQGGEVYKSGPSSYVSGGSPSWHENGPVPSPAQQMAIAGRETEAYQAEEPSRRAAITGGLGVAEQEAKSKGDLDVAKETGNTGFNRYYNKLSDTLGVKAPGAPDASGQPQSPLPPGIKSMSKNSIVAQSNPRPTRIPQQLLQSLSNSRRNMENGVQGADVQFQNDMINVFGQSGYDSNMQQFVLGIARDPMTKDMTPDQILHNMGEDSLSPEELNQYYELLGYARGR